MNSNQQSPESAPWDSPAKRLWKRVRPTGMSTGLVALSSFAILSVYAVGYENTQPSEDLAANAGAVVTTANQPVATATTAARATSTSVTSPSVPGAATAAATPTTAARATATTAASSAATTSGYADGTYTGTGSSRHGSITATVVVSGGKVVSAEITTCGTRYPCSKVASLPGVVVATQKAPTTYISGATDSSIAYTGAVNAALAKAKA